MEAALRFGAHAAKQLSCSSLTLNKPLRSLGFGVSKDSTKTMRSLHIYGS
jgi:hypothetical protein